MPYGALPDLMKSLTHRAQALLQDHSIQHVCVTLADEFVLWDLIVREDGQPAKIYPAWLPRVVAGVFNDLTATTDDKWFEEAKRICKPITIDLERS